MPEQQPNGWTEWSKHVLLELERLNRRQDRMGDDIGDINTKISVLARMTEQQDSMAVDIGKIRSESISEIRRDIAMLQVKAGVWGFAAGLLPAIGLLLVQVLK